MTPYEVETEEAAIQKTLGEFREELLFQEAIDKLVNGRRRTGRTTSQLRNLIRYMREHDMNGIYLAPDSAVATGIANHILDVVNSLYLTHDSVIREGRDGFTIASRSGWPCNLQILPPGRARAAILGTRAVLTMDHSVLEKVRFEGRVDLMRDVLAAGLNPGSAVDYGGGEYPTPLWVPPEPVVVRDMTGSGAVSGH